MVSVAHVLDFLQKKTEPSNFLRRMLDENEGLWKELIVRK